MLTLREAVGAASVIVGAAVLAAVNHHPTTGRRTEGNGPVQAAANQLTYQQISDAWTQTKLGNFEPLNAIRQRVALRYLATHQEGDAIILTFESRSDRCLDLVSRPTTNAVEARRC